MLMGVMLSLIVDLQISVLRLLVNTARIINAENAVEVQIICIEKHVQFMMIIIKSINMSKIV